MTGNGPATGTGGEGSTASVFISYSRRDKDFVRRLSGLLAEPGRRVWVDWQDIPPSARWRAEIFGAIEASEVFVFVMSPASLSSEVCRDELAHAFALNKRVLPLVIADVDQEAVLPELAALNWLAFRPADDFERSHAAMIIALDTDLEWVKAHARLMVQSLEWESKADKSLLLRGSELDAAERALATRPANPEPTATQARYVLASRQASTHRQRRTVTAAFASVVIVSVLGSFAWVQRGQAREQTRTARSGELAAKARLQLDIDPQASLLLAIASYEKKATPAAESVLRQAVVDSVERATLPSDQRAVFGTAFAPDGERVVSGGADGTVRVWAVGGGDPVVLRGHEGAVNGVAFSTGGFVASAGQDATVRVWVPVVGATSGPLILRGHQAPWMAWPSLRTASRWQAEVLTPRYGSGPGPKAASRW